MKEVKRQRDVECEVEGCKVKSRYGNMCQKHIMALRRYGNVRGKQMVVITCKTCGAAKEVKRDSTRYCSEACYEADEETKKKKREALKRFRDKRNDGALCIMSVTMEPPGYEKYSNGKPKRYLSRIFKIFKKYPAP
ncbi:MAG: hypothetical protein GY782_01405 [Gammaproteobacteria bacterium]|nr:hypothetical protein [Gammaproteobacteria bacterium]